MHQKNDADIQNIFLKCNCSNLKASFSNRKVSSKEVEGFFQERWFCTFQSAVQLCLWIVCSCVCNGKAAQ